MGDNGSARTPANGVVKDSQMVKSNTARNANLPKIIIPDRKTSSHHVKEKKPSKKKIYNKSDLGDNFVAPDGGWGWMVSVSSGINILVTLSMAQQFGIIFRDHMAKLGITNSELTTIINVQFAVSAITGLLNGPMFRRFSYRQVALMGSCLTFIGLFATSFANSFIFYCISFSCFYGFGRGLSVSASSLAVNTYFKEKRRTATAYQYGVAGVGPIIFPYVATLLLEHFGVQGTVMIFSGLALNGIACSLMYQPVKWHVKKQSNDVEASKKLTPIEEDDEDDIIAHPVEPESPALPRANDGWYGSKISLNTPTVRSRLGTWEKQQQEEKEQMIELKRLTGKGYMMNNNSNSSSNGKLRSFSISYSIKEEEEEHDSSDSDDMDKKQKEHQKLRKQKAQAHPLIVDEEERRKKLPWYKKVSIFFDLDLLRDFTYVNLSLGLTMILFVEVNFGILTPFILSDFGFQKNQIAMAMSILGLFDLIIRFLIPVITSKITMSNQAFFAVGILGMCIGRICLSFTTDFYVMIAIFIWMGLNKALRTVFWSLILPGYVPLKRLPAAAGLQLLMSGIFSLSCGPLLGLIRDHTNYSFTLNFLNLLCIIAIAGWVLEYTVRKYKNKPSQGLK